MKNFILLASLFFTINCIAQNVGINNNDPQAALDLNGSFRTRAEQIAVSNGMVNITDNKSMVWITGTPLQPFTMLTTSSYNQNGIRLIIYNGTSVTGTLNPVSISPR
jgi:hypothetical protein